MREYCSSCWLHGLGCTVNSKVLGRHFDIFTTSLWHSVFNPCQDVFDYTLCAVFSFVQKFVAVPAVFLQQKMNTCKNTPASPATVGGESPQ